MPTQQKIDLVQDIKGRLERSTIVMTATYTGISVNAMVELRRAMRGGGVEFTIVKNTLLSLAADAAQKPQMREIVQGPTAIALGYDDPATAAKVVADYIRTGQSPLTIMGAVMGDGAPMSAAEVTHLASLPPKAELLAMLLGQMQAPIARLLSVLNGPLQALDNVLQARVSQMESEAPAPPSGAEPEAQPDAASETAGETETVAESEDTPTAEASADEEPAAEVEDASEPEPAAEEAPPDEPEAEPDSEPEPAAEEAPADEPETEPDSESEAETDADADEEPQAE